MLLSSYISLSTVPIILQVCLALFLGRAIAWAIYYRYFHPYKNYPGPFWASITSLWYFRAVRHARGQDTQLAIHKKYGPFVRVSPDQVQIMDPSAMETIVRLLLRN